MKYFFIIIIILIGFTTMSEGQENQSSSTIRVDKGMKDDIVYFRTGLGYNLITLKDELISPDVYSGSGLYLPTALKVEWKYLRAGSHLNMHLGWLSPTLNESTYALADLPEFTEGLKYEKRYLHTHFLIYVQRRIKESRHFLGGSTQVFINSVKALKQIESSHLKPFFDDLRTEDIGFSADISYTYATQLFKRPLNINVSLPVIYLQKTPIRKQWNFAGPNNILRPNLNIDLAVNALYNEFNYTTWRLFYDWKMTYNDRKGGTHYQQFSGINTVGILVDFGGEMY